MPPSFQNVEMYDKLSELRRDLLQIEKRPAALTVRPKLQEVSRVAPTHPCWRDSTSAKSTVAIRLRAL